MSAELQAKIIEQPPLDETTGFDYRVHIKDAKTGRIVRVQHYARHARGGEVLLERPVGSGNCYTENGKPAGQWNFQDKAGKPVWEKIGEKHIDVAVEAASREDELSAKNEALELEIAALRAEAKAAVPTGKVQKN